MNINLSASAAFLASVTATTLQYGQVNPGPGSVTAVATLVMWYTSLAFAVTSALLSLLKVIIRLHPQ